MKSRAGFSLRYILAASASLAALSTVVLAQETEPPVEDAPAESETEVSQEAAETNDWDFGFGEELERERAETERMTAETAALTAVADRVSQVADELAENEDE